VPEPESVYTSPPVMAAVVGPPQASERKRVKVYELKNNDWFDRGTGFCKGAVTAVSPGVRLPLQSTVAPKLRNCNGILANLCDYRMKKQRFSSYPKMIRIEPSSKRASPRTTVTKNNRVRTRRSLGQDSAKHAQTP
jgi:hypothetical protein